MKKLIGIFAFFTPLVFLSAAEAVSEAERFILHNPAALRRVFLGVVLLLGVAIIVIRAFFNRKITGRNTQGLPVDDEAKGAPGGSEPVKLRSAKLVEMHENMEYQIPLDRVLTIGRVFENTVVVKNPAASRHHAKIVPEQEGYVIYDLGSKKGTFVNGVMVSRRVLRNSDIIEIARDDFLFIYL